MTTLELLGNTLRKPDGSTVSCKEALAGKEVLGLYFSAHWCPPCRGFTPSLCEKYTALQKAGKSFEMVFVSSDKNEDAFNEYHNSMTFLGLPYSERDAKAKLSKKFKVQGIPTLVFIDAQTGKLITADGREAISEDTFIDDFPYKQEPVDVVQVLGEKLRKPDGSTVSKAEALAGKDVLGLYFSAHWCPPCRGFTPTLCEKYTALIQAGKSMEMIFVSSDRDEDAFNEYHNSMTFLGLPFSERSAKTKLSKHFGVEGIPTLAFVDLKTGGIITTNGRGGISGATFVEDFPYHPKPVNDFGESLDGINENSSLIVLMDDCDKDTQASLTAMLTEIAVGEFKKAEDDRMVEKFFTAKGEGPVDQIKSKCGYAEPSKLARLLLLDLSDEGAYYHPIAGKEEVNAANVKAFMQDFKDEKLSRRQFGK
jgi:nucleoredoxin